MLYKKINKVSQQIEKIIKIKLKDFNLSIGQWEVLKEIYLSDNSEINANDLEKKLEIDKRSLSLTLKKLEQLKYIQRVENEDKRKKILYLTDFSLEIAEDLITVEEEIENILNQSLTNNKILEQGLSKIENELLNLEENKK